MNWNLSNETSNDLMTDGRNLPWLQDTEEVDAKTAFEAVYRDVIIVDAWNRPVGPRFNLTTFDLASAVNRGALKELLRRAAVWVDTDHDGVADDWEERYHDGLQKNRESDSDLDRADLFLEYSLGSDPLDGASRPLIETGVSERLFFVSFRQRMGTAGGLKYLLEASETGEFWDSADDLFVFDSKTNPYDGTGTEQVRYTAAIEAGDARLFRVRVLIE